jgi:hypothetical protein
MQLAIRQATMPMIRNRFAVAFDRAFLLFLIAWLAIQVRLSFAAISPFEGIPFDGPFQLLDSLRRIDAGQIPGRDFPVFHGPGVPLLHYPLYRALGADLFAAEFARQTVCRILGGVACLLAFRSVVGSAWPCLALLAASIPGIAALSKWPELEPFLIGFNMSPVNSSLPLRCATPFIFFAIAFSFRSGFAREITLSICLGLAPFLGAEQGLALWAAVAATGVLTVVMHRPIFESPSNRWAYVRIAAFGMIASAAFSWALCGHRLNEMLRFHFVDLPRDQFWFFGAPPQPFLMDGTRAGTIGFIYLVFFGSVAACWAIAGSFRMRSATDDDSLARRQCRVMLGLYAGLSLVSMFGYAALANAAVAWRTIVMLAAFELSRILTNCRSCNEESTRFSSKPSKITTKWALSSLASIVILIAAYRATRPGTLSETWSKVDSEIPSIIRKSIPRPVDGSLWSVYAGLVESDLGLLHPELDYAIHALGEHRRSYTERFVELQPTFVLTIERSAFPFDQWLQASNWGFFERLATNYRLDHVVTGAYRLWRRSDSAWKEPASDWSPLSVSADGQRIEIPAGSVAGGLAVVRLHYRIRNPLAAVPVLGGQPRFLVDAVGSLERYAISLPPDVSHHDIPVYFDAKSPVSLHLRAAGLTLGASVRIDKAEVRYLPHSPEIQELFPWSPMTSGE